jgi:predicted HD superfamily hydrolase involved in NAD metabolism
LKLDIKQNKYINDLETALKSRMSPELYSHSIETLEYSSKIADFYIGNDLDRIDLFTACLLHDYGKVFSIEELKKIAKDENLILSNFELNCAALLHGFVCPYLIKRDFKIKNSDILDAVRYHTIGSCKMSLIDKILYISDKIGGKRIYEGIDVLRELSLSNIELCLLEVYKSNIIYVIKKNNFLHPDTCKIWNYICGGLNVTR